MKFLKTNDIMVLISFIWGIFKEAFAKKIILSIIIFFSLIIILFLYFVNLDSVEGVQSLLKLYGKEQFYDALLDFEFTMLSGIPRFMLVSLFLIMSSSFIPSMLKEGNIDLILSKPVSRAKIILGHFIAGILIVFLSFLIIIGIIWLIISAKTGIWHFSFMLSVFWLTAVFAVLYISVIFFALITKNSVITIVINIFLYFPVTWGLYTLNIFFNKQTQLMGPIGEFIVKFFYFIFPKPWDIFDIGQNLIKGETVASYMPLYTSVFYIVLMFLFSVLYFRKKDY
jgi:ABC-2 type transport system permease protein